MSEIGAITQGMQSVQGTGMYTARLDAFTKNAKAFEAYDFNKGFESEAAKKQKDAATFAEVALGFKTVPDSTNLYNKHHALLSKKYDLLFDDANISAMAATPEGRAAFDRAVQQLQQETKAYENIYAATFGDPNKADGTGITYADHLQRKRSGGSRDFFGLKGVSIDRDDQYFENRLIALDTADDFSSLTFNPQTGQWEGVSQDEDLSLDMGTASQYFTYTMSQASFNSPSTYAQDKPLYEMFKDQNEAAVRQNLVSRRSMMQMEAVAYYQSTLPDGDDKKKLTPQQYRDKLASEDMLEKAHEAFENSIVDGLQERQRKEEEDAKDKKEKTGGGGGGNYSRYNVVGDPASRSIPLTTSGLGVMPEGSFQYAKLVGEKLVIVLKKDEVEQEYPAENYKNVLTAKFGPDAIAKMIKSLGDQVQSVNTENY
jgi:hypothetical protein